MNLGRGAAKLLPLLLPQDGRGVEQSLPAEATSLEDLCQEKAPAPQPAPAALRAAHGVLWGEGFSRALLPVLGTSSS